MAKVRDLIAAGPTLSFEFFPPKTDEAERTLEKTVAELAPLAPSFVDVTYGALGSTRERTRDIVVRINRDQQFPAVAHLTCVGHTRADIDALLAEYAANGVGNLLALGGDPPADGSDPGGDFAYASELLEVVKASGDFSVGVAAHPELHPRSPDRESDRRHLAAKLETADFALTQFFYYPEDHFRMMDELAALGCDTPVIPGIMLWVFAGVAGLERMATMNGSRLPPGLMEAIDRAEGPDEVRRIAVDTATELAAQLLDGGVPGLHVYTLNRSQAAIELVENLGLRPGQGDGIHQ